MIIYSNGCSHTHGHCVGIENSYPSLIMRRLTNNFFSHTSNINEFDINEIMKFDNVFINESICGAGNDYIFHKSLESLTKLINNKKKPNYVIIQWSGPNRRQHCLPDGQILNVNLFDNIEYHVKFEPMASLHTLHYIYMLQEFLKKENIMFYFFNYMMLDESIKNTNIYNEIDFDYFIDFGFGKEILTKGIIDYIIKNKMSCDKEGHPNEDGNKFISEEILKKIWTVK